MGENVSDYVSETGYYRRLSDEERDCAERFADVLDEYSDFQIEHDLVDVLRVVSPWGRWVRLTLLFVEGRPPHFGVRLFKRGRLDAVRALLARSPAVKDLCEDSKGPYYFDLWSDEVVLDHLPDLVEQILSLG